MVCILDRETYRRWERWFNQSREMAIPDRYQARDYVNPYQKFIAAGKSLNPDPPYKPKSERELNDLLLSPEERKEKRRNREAARARLKRLAAAFERAEAVLIEPEDGS